jgi:hypothetical protein
MKSKVILVTGKAQSGKNSACEYIKLKLKAKGLSSKLYAFADPLKEICVGVLGLTPSQCWGENKYKDEDTEFSWGDLPFSGEALAKLMSNMSTNEKLIKTSDKMTAREVMQVWGTDVFRKFHNSCWVNSTLSSINKDGFDYALICDARFPNELDEFEDQQPFVVRLTRNVKNLTHDSETLLDDYKWNKFKFYTIIDNSNMTVDDKNYFINLALENFLENNDNRTPTQQTGRVLRR